MLKGRGGPEMVLGLVVIGGHSVASALIAKQIKQAICESLGVAVIALVFVGVHALIDLAQKKGDDE
jgi:hypothetical protein